MSHKYTQPVNVSFRFDGVSRSPARHSIYGAISRRSDFTAFPVRREGSALVYKTTIMPGSFIRFQLFGEQMMTKPLLHGPKLTEDGVVAGTVPDHDTTYDFDVNKPVQ